VHDEAHVAFVQEEMAALSEVLGEFDPQSLQMGYSIGCELPRSMVGAIVGRSGENIKQIEEASGTQIEIENEETPDADTPRFMTIVGSLVSVYIAKSMIIKKQREMEAKEREEAEEKAIEQTEDPEVLKAKIAQLQAALAAAQAK